MIRIPLRPLAKILRAREKGQNPDEIEAEARRLRHELDAVADGRADIVIGTQLVAKGHHFPKMTLVGAIDADLGLGNGDPRAAERTFQLLQQVTGRAGRGERPASIRRLPTM